VVIDFYKLLTDSEFVKILVEFVPCVIIGAQLGDDGQGWYIYSRSTQA